MAAPASYLVYPVGPAGLNSSPMLGGNRYHGHGRPALLAVVCAVVLVTLVGHVSGQPRLWNMSALKEAKLKTRAGEPLAGACGQLLAKADKVLLTRGNCEHCTHWWRVTDKPVALLPASHDAHDYYSIGPYAWPCNLKPRGCKPYPGSHWPTDCDNSTGLPWVDCDGIFNTEVMDELDYGALQDLDVLQLQLHMSTAAWSAPLMPRVDRCMFFCLCVCFSSPAAFWPRSG